MPTFQLVIRDTHGQLQQRQESADSRTALLAKLQQKGEAVMSCREQGASASRFSWRQKPAPVFNLLLFCRELQILLQAGLPLMEALLTLNDRQGASAYPTVITPLLQRLQEGHSFSQALVAMPDTFPRLFVAMIAASEHSGALDEALVRYIAYQESWRAVRGKLISASIYPLILIGVGSLVCGFMLLYLAPKFSLVYQQARGPLHFSTQLMVGWGSLVQAHRPIVLAVLMSLISAAIITLRLPATRERAWQRLLRIGPLRQLMHIVYCAQFYRTLALLLRAGHTVLQSLELSRQVLPAFYQAHVNEAARVIQQGSGLSDAFARYGLTTDIAQRMLHSGESSGKLAHMLEQTALFHEHEIMEKIDRTTRIVEPVLMLLMGLVIGTLVIGMYLPIFDVAGQL